MAGGCINFLIGHRGEFERCKYWNRDEDDNNLAEYTYQKENGTFWAKEVSPEDLRKLVINGLFMFDETLITLYTKSDCRLKKGDIVEHDGSKWIVQSCQQRTRNKYQQFMKTKVTDTYIQLKQ